MFVYMHAYSCNNLMQNLLQVPCMLQYFTCMFNLPVTCILDVCIMNAWVTCLLQYWWYASCMKHEFLSYCACDMIITYHNETCSSHNWFLYTVFKPNLNIIEVDKCDWILENWPKCHTWPTYSILLAQLIDALIHYPCTVALTGLADWSAFLELVLLTMWSHNWDNGAHGGH